MSCIKKIIIPLQLTNLPIHSLWVSDEGNICVYIAGCVSCATNSSSQVLFESVFKNYYLVHKELLVFFAITIIFAI